MSNEELKPISPERLAKELRRICGSFRNGEIKADEYEHRFARMIGELRDRRIDGNRAEILAVLSPLQAEGVVSPTEWLRLTKQLGLA